MVGKGRTVKIIEMWKKRNKTEKNFYQRKIARFSQRKREEYEKNKKNKKRAEQ